MNKSNIRQSRSIIRKLCVNRNGAVKGFQEEDGSVESAFVLIPLLILFLVTMQIGVAINFRNIDRTFVQSEAAERAISGQFNSKDRIMEVNPIGSSNALGILVTRKVRRIPILIPLIGSFINNGHNADLNGIAVIESLS